MNSGSLSNRFHTATIAAGVATMLFMVTSCSAGSNQVAASPDNDSVTTSPSASPSASAVAISAGAKPGDVIKGIPTKKELANDGKGTYIQATVADDSPLFTYKASAVQDTATALFSEADIVEAQKVAAKFIVEEVLDSTMNGNPTDTAVKEAWWVKNKDRYHPDSQAEMHADVMGNDDNKPITYRGYFRKNYDLAYGNDTTHLNAYTLDLTSVGGGEAKGLPGLGFYYNSTFSMNANVDGNKTLEASNATTSLSLVKDNGKWLIVGYELHYSTQPVK